ncbi:MAG: phosphopantetheine-binding protein [Caldilineaceae bacterium]
MKTVDDILTLAKGQQMLKVPAGIQADVPLREQGLDSLDVIMLLHEVEVNFNLTIPPEQTNRLQCLQDIVDFVNAK